MDSLTSLNKSVTARFHYLKLTEEKFSILSCDVSFVFQCFSIEHDNTQLVGTQKNYRNREAEMATNSIQAIPNQTDTFDQLLFAFRSSHSKSGPSNLDVTVVAITDCKRSMLKAPMIHIIHITVAIESSLSPLSPKSKKVAHHFSDLK